jgi:hypothetical protein
MKGWREKWVFSGGGYKCKMGGNIRGIESEYGECTLYPYMKIEEFNLLKLF